MLKISKATSQPLKVLYLAIHGFYGAIGQAAVIYPPITDLFNHNE